MMDHRWRKYFGQNVVDRVYQNSIRNQNIGKIFQIVLQNIILLTLEYFIIVLWHLPNSRKRVNWCCMDMKISLLLVPL